MIKQVFYYSTNRNLSKKGHIHPFKGLLSFKEALLMGQAPDEGLFMPDFIPTLAMSEIEKLRGLSYQDVAFFIARLFLAHEFSDDVLQAVVKEAYNFPVPLERVYDRKYLLRLDQGPTASFKDFAARMMARLMSHCLKEGEQLNILVATSGDTGSAVGAAFHGVAGINVYILYPQTEVSPRQKKQLDSIGDNVHALSIEGKFDDCQSLVKEAFADADLAKYNLTSANSINFGRILPQLIYYFYAYANVTSHEEKIVFSVPSGNFGNALGCEFARRMGLPVYKLLVPTNENDEFPRFLKTGHYEKVSPSRACLSNAMNVGHPSNLARFFDLYGGTIDRKGFVHKYPDIEEMRRRLFSVSVSDEETRDTIKRVYVNFGVLLEPHGAVGWRGLEVFMEKEGNFEPAVVLETAHPAKFPEEINNLLGIAPELPPSLKEIDAKEGISIALPADYRAFKDFLLSNLKK